MPTVHVLTALIVLAPQVVEEIAQQISDRYVLIAEAPRIADQLFEQALTGKYDQFPTPPQLAEALTADLRAISGDLHFAVEHDPMLAERLRAENAAHSRKLPEPAPTE